MAWPFTAKPKERIEPTFLNASPENPSTSLADPATWLYEAFGAVPSFAGPSVSENSAMRFATVFACVSLKAGLIGELPLKVYKRTAKGREDASGHKLYPLLHDEPNDLMSSFIWKELIGVNLLLSGNHFSVIEYDNAARVTGFVPVMPQQTTVERINGRNRYRFQFKDGEEVLDQSDVIHVPGVGFDGIKGVSPITWAGRQPIGIGLAMEESIARLHANGMRPSVTVTMPPGIKPEAFKLMKAQIDASYGGLGNVGKAVYIDNGAKIDPWQISPEDAQVLENRRFQVSDICRIFGIPPHMVGETDKTTSWGTGIEQQTIGFLKFSLAKDLSRIEGELNRKLFRAPFYCEFDRVALAAMDAKTQAELFASAINNAGMTPNEVRGKRNLPGVGPDGDKLYIQSGTVPLEMAGKQQKQPVDPKPQPPKDPRGPA